MKNIEKNIAFVGARLRHGSQGSGGGFPPDAPGRETRNARIPAAGPTAVSVV
jgi:hypothetical protein